MKPTQVTELFANIKNTFVSFFSIFMFAALGVGIFLGISWAGPAVEAAADHTLDEGSFHNFQVQFPYGLTDDDVKQLSKVEGVTQVETARQSFETVVVDGKNVTVKLQTMGADIDVPIVAQGELPTKSGEIALHAQSASKIGAGVGDTVTFEKSDDADADDNDGSKYLNNRTYKVTAIIDSPDYLANDSLTYGISATPSGKIDALAWVLPDEFDSEAFQDGYPIVNVVCDSLDGKGTYTDEYKSASDAIKPRLEELGDKLATERYDDLHGQAQEKIDDAQKQLDEGKQKIADGEKQIADGEKQLADGRAELEARRAEGEAQLADALNQLQYYEAQVAEAEAAVAEAEYLLEAGRAALRGRSDDEIIEYEGHQMTVAEARGYVAQANPQLVRAENDLYVARQRLDDGWNQYYAGQAQLEAAVAEGEQKIADGERQLADARQQVADAKQQVAENEPKLEDAKAQLEAMAKYSWTVSPRMYNAGVANVSVFSGVTNNLSVSMAALFIIVGLLVSYFAVSRIVREQITQIGTKKALGFRQGEITTSYLLYSGIAVVAGAIVGTIVGYFVVEGIISGVLGGMFCFGAYPAYFGWGLFLIVTLIELLLVLGATYLACRSILKEHAVELLRGPKPPTGKTHFYEKWGIWDKLPLLIQTIVNNCVNDKRRVLSTIVGVAGATALIVTAITLNNDVLKSYDKHYAEVYNFNARAYVDDEPKGSIDNVEAALVDNGCTTAQVVCRAHMFEELDDDGGLASVNMLVPADVDAFSKVYHLPLMSGGEADLSQDGAYFSQAYATHLGAKVGDKVTVNGLDGTEHQVEILGFYDFWLTYYEMVMGRDYYEREFGEFEPNVVLADTGDVAVSDIEDDLSKVEGFYSIYDDKAHQHVNFETFSAVSSAVVAIYLALAALMSVVVLLNLNVMFIDEKKRELIVLMINGFSVKDAKHYISYDNIVLTALGIIVGLILGCVMGSITVAAIEPATAVFVKSVDGWAVGIGIIGSAILAIIMGAIALRRIPRFELTDINKF